MTELQIVATTLPDLVSQTRELLRSQGVRRPPARRGPAGVRSVLELMPYSAVLQKPRNRLLHGDGRSYSPGQAAARFLYFISGSDRRDHIELYAGSVSNYSPDGVAVGGSCHGARIFSRFGGQSLLDRCIASLEADGESNRAVIPFYRPEDVGCGHLDAPCVLAAMLYQRSGILHMVVQMRAQELDRLFAYDLFEFTMLHEFVAATLRLELGTYTHGAWALHVLERDNAPRTGLPAPFVPSDDRNSPLMSCMPADAETRRNLVTWETRLREQILAGRAVAALRAMRAETPPYWFDLLAAAAAHATSRRQGPEAAAEFIRLAEPAHVVLNLELESIANWQRACRGGARGNI